MMVQRGRLLVGVLVVCVAICVARPKPKSHQVKPRKNAESSQLDNKKQYSQTPYSQYTFDGGKTRDKTDKTDGSKYEVVESNPELHKVKLYKDNGIPFNPSDFDAKYASPYYVTKEDISEKGVVPKNEFVVDKKAPTEFVWPKLDDTDTVPDHITKPAKRKVYQWVKHDKCDHEYDCPPGRSCHHGWCECMVPEQCFKHHKPVCGSDGYFYPSHCELHRTACIEQRHIRIDHKGDCFQPIPGDDKPGFIDVKSKIQDSKEDKSTVESKKIEKNEKYNKGKEQDTNRKINSEPKDVIGKTENFETKKKEYIKTKDVKDEKFYKPDDYDDDDSVHGLAKPPVVKDNDGEDDYYYDDYEYDDKKDKVSQNEGGDGESKKGSKSVEKSSKKASKDEKSETENKQDDLNSKAVINNNEKDKAVDNDDNDDTNDFMYDFETPKKEYNKKVHKEDKKPVTEKEAPYKLHTDEDGKVVKKTEKMPTSNSMCSQDDYDDFKERLIMFHCTKFGEPDCEAEVINDRAYLAKLMFRFYDGDMDQTLTGVELKEHALDKDVLNIGSGCTLLDMLMFEELATPGVINLGDFYTIFSLKKAQLFNRDQVTNIVATVGHGLELSCGIHGGEGNIVWQRNGVDVKSLHMPDITSFSDGSLYISQVSVHHTGNFTCFDRSNGELIQTHNIHIQMVPIVRIVPGTQMHTAHTDVQVRCHAEGIPYPKISWQINEEPLPRDGHYMTMYNNHTLLIHNTEYERDTGAYKCMAHNEAGLAQHIATVFIENSTVPDEERTHGLFAVFHSIGYTVYDPLGCNIYHYVSQTFDNFKISSDENPSPLLCPNKVCMWGKAVLVRGAWIYVSQPELNRVVVIQSSGAWNPVQVIDTDKVPMAIHYMEHLDEVWILCWNGPEDSGSKTIVVVRDASKDGQHRVVHTQPVGDKFDLVKNLFLAPTNDLYHWFLHGYVTHNGQHGLYKLDTEEMKYVKSVDLSQYDCLPLHVAFVPIGGKILIQCKADTVLNIKYFLLEMDYLSDQVLTKLDIRGKPFVSPDSRNVVVVDYNTGDAHVYSVSDQGEIHHSHLVSTGSIISDVTFHMSHDHVKYDAFLNSHMRDEVFCINLVDGSFTTIQGEDVWMSDTWIYDSPYHSMTGGGAFSDYILKTNDAGVTIIRGDSHAIQCRFDDQEKSHEVIWVGP